MWIYNSKLCNTIIDGSLEGVNLYYTDFTGSTGAIVDLEKVIYQDTNFYDALVINKEFSDVFVSNSNVLSKELDEIQREIDKAFVKKSKRLINY